MSLTNNVQINLSSNLTGSVGLATLSASVSQSISSRLDTVACDSLFSVTGTISGGAVSYDLVGSLTDPLGDAVTFAKVMAVFFRNNGDNAMTVGGANNVPIFANTSDLLNVAADAYNLYIDPTGVAVTGTNDDIITVTGTNDDTYDLIVIGSST